MLISSVTPAGPPPTVTIIAPEEWTQVEMRLEEFATTTPASITAYLLRASDELAQFPVPFGDPTVHLNRARWGLELRHFPLHQTALPGA